MVFHPFQRFCSNLAKLHLLTTSHLRASSASTIVKPASMTVTKCRNIVPTPLWCRPALMMMPNHHSVVVGASVKQSKRPKPPRTRFQRRKCLVVIHLRGSVQDVQEKSPYPYIYASTYTYTSSLYIKRYSSPRKG